MRDFFIGLVVFTLVFLLEKGQIIPVLNIRSYSRIFPQLEAVCVGLVLLLFSQFIFQRRQINTSLNFTKVVDRQAKHQHDRLLI